MCIHMPTTTDRILSIADARRASALGAAVRAFAAGSYHSTTIGDVAAAAEISPAYVMRLFGSRLSLFLAALDECHDRIVAALEQAADAADSDDPEVVLDVMGAGYAELIADRSLLMLQVHALSACDVPEIAEKVRDGYRRVVGLVDRGHRSPAPRRSLTVDA